MDKPSFSLDVFEGPLDLLLHLISKNKLNIYDINISELLDQYTAFIEKVAENKNEISSEFLEMASRLVYIKSVSLLPKDETDNTLKDELSGELLEYSICRSISEHLRNTYIGSDVFIREPADIPPDLTYTRTHEKELLATSYLSAIGRGMRRLPPSEESFKVIVHRKVISVSSKIVSLLRSLRKNSKIRYKSLFEGNTSKSEAVATFLAVLELIKANRIKLHGGMDNPEIEMSDNKSLQTDQE